MKILFTGLQGLLGSHLSNLILKDISYGGPFVNAEFFSVVRNYRNNNLSLSSNTLSELTFYCDCNNIESFCKILKQVKPDLIVHIAQLRLTKFILKSIELSKITYPKMIVVGTLGVFSNFQSCRQEYEEAESLINTYNNHIILLRSSMIYGSRYDKNIHRLISLILNLKVLPLPSNGNSLFQPVFYQDISLAIFLTIKKYITKGIFQSNILNLSGPDTLSLNQICKIIAKRLSKELLFINVNNDNILLILNFLESINIKIPRLKAEQFLRLKEDKVFKSNWENHIFKIKPTSFEKGIDSQINSLMKNDYFSSNIIFRDYDHL